MPPEGPALCNVLASAAKEERADQLLCLHGLQPGKQFTEPGEGVELKSELRGSDGDNKEPQEATGCTSPTSR